MSAPQTLAHTWLPFAMAPTLTAIPHDLSIQVPSTMSLTQCLNMTISGSQKREADCLALVLSTVDGRGQLGSYLLAFWGLRVGQVTMDSEEMIAFLWKQTESCKGRARHDPRKVWSNLIILHMKKLGLREVK